MPGGHGESTNHRVNGFARALSPSVEAVVFATNSLDAVVRGGLGTKPHARNDRIAWTRRWGEEALAALRLAVDMTYRVDAHVVVDEGEPRPNIGEDGDGDAEVDDGLLALLDQVRAALRSLEENNVAVVRRCLPKDAPALAAVYEQLHSCALERVRGLVALLGFFAGTGDDVSLGIQFIPPVDETLVPGTLENCLGLDEILASIGA